MIFCEANGKPSLMRVIIGIITVLCSVTILCGIIGWFLKLGNAPVIIGSGIGGYGVSSWAKAIQKKAE